MCYVPQTQEYGEIPGEQGCQNLQLTATIQNNKVKEKDQKLPVRTFKSRPNTHHKST